MSGGDIHGPAGVDVPFNVFSAEEISAFENVAVDSALSSKTPLLAHADGGHAADVLTFVLDFKETTQGTTTDIFGNDVSSFDVSSYGFAAGDFNTVANSILAEVDEDYFSELIGTVAGPSGQDLDVDFIIGDIGTAPVGLSEYYYVQIGTGIAGPHSGGTLGVAGGSVVRNDSGTGPNFGIVTGDVVASVFTDAIVTLSGLSPSNALTSGNFGFTTNAISGTLSHEIGHTLSLSHINKAASVQPTTGASPLMGTGAIDLPNNDRIGDREFSLSGVDGQNGNAPRQHIQQLVDAVGLHSLVANSAEIHGQKWNDLDGDGVRDPGEPGLNGWVIELYDDQGTLITNQTTADMDLDSSGSIDPETERGLYWFTGLAAATYTVGEVAQPGWIQTSPGGVMPPDLNGFNVEKLSELAITAFPGGNNAANDVAGYVSPSGREYAIIGLSHGTGYVDLTDPANPVIVGFISGADELIAATVGFQPEHNHEDEAADEFCSTGECEGASAWRDIKTYDQYAYVTNETGGGLQIIDLTQIDSGIVTEAGTLTASGLNRAHNIAIDPDSGFAYVLGSNIANGGLVVVDVGTNPAAPTIVGTWSERYLHDAEIVSYTSGPLAGQQIAYGFAEGSGVKVINVTNKASMTTLATVPYPNVTYSHYGTLSDDLQYLFVNDELDERDDPDVSTTTTYVIDVSNPASPVYHSSFTNGLPAIDHNLETRGDYLFEANYTTGLRVFDVSDVNNIHETGYYDTYPDNNSTIFDGAWGVNTDLPSGIVLVSDIESGLFVLDPSEATGGFAPANFTSNGTSVADKTTHADGFISDRASTFFAPKQTRLNDPGAYLTSPSDAASLDIAAQYLRKNAIDLGLTVSDFDEFRITDQYVSEHLGVTHIYLRQMYNGLDITGADININVTEDGRVINVGSTFLTGLRTSGLTGAGTADTAQPALSAVQALQSLADEFGWVMDAAPALLDSVNNLGQTTLLAASGVSMAAIPAALHYVPTQHGIELAWNLNVQTVDRNHWYDSSVSATSGELIALADWVDDATYNVFELPLENPDDGARTLEVDPFDVAASPFGWHDTNGVAGAEFTDTRGNNVFAQEDRLGTDSGLGTRPDGGATLDFDFTLDLALDPIDYQDAAITNLFYWNNILHDVHYQYGFDEVSGNFQVNNYGNGGLGNDEVQADAQYGADVGQFNNAFFGTPPDGSQPQMLMLEFNITVPNRDGDFSNSIIIHEYGHGVSNRLTGGPANAGALNAIQSGGMGEGWGDWWSLMLTQKPGDGQFDAYPVGTYVLGQPPTGAGIRRFPYSFDMTIDPLTYGDFNGSNEVHDTGEIWASALWDLNWLLINGDGGEIPAMGFDADLYTGTGGNNLALQLVMDGLKLQSANPSFLDGRDAILMADQVANGGANQLAIWTAFARRGMGFSADDGGSGNATTVVEAFDLPATSAGVIDLNATSYEVGDVVTTTVRDSDVAGGGPINVTVVSDGGDTETVTLTEVVAGVFEGTIVTSASGTSGDGTLNVVGGNLITATYNDADDGTGNPAVVNVTADIITFVNIFVQDFESGLGTNESISGAFSNNNTNAPLNNGTLMMGHPATYGNDEYTYYELTLDLAGFSNVQMEFDYTSHIEDHFDRFNVLASTSPISPPNDLLTPTSGLPYEDQGDVRKPELGQIAYDSGGALDSGVAVFDLSAFDGQVVNIRMQFGSDGSVTNPGINIDNLLIRAAGGGLLGTHTVVLTSGQIVTGIDFGNHQLSVPDVMLSVDQGSIAEAGGVAIFTATLSTAASQDVTVDLGFSGTATLTDDFIRSSNQIVITAGNTAGTIDVTAVQDAVIDPGEMIVVDIINVTNANELGIQQSTTTITDDEFGADLSVTTQGNETGPVDIVYTVTLNRPNNTGSTITFDLADLLTGTATSGDDYTAIPANAQISVAVNDTTGTLSVPVIDDGLLENTETLIAQISNPSSAAVTIVTNSATANIFDKDRFVQIIDNGETGFAIESGTWGSAGGGVNSNIRFAATGDGSAVASWTFTGLVAGQYRVSATWAAHNNRATDSPFTIYDGGTERGTVDVDQQLVPSGSPELTDLGAAWQDLGGLHSITGDTLVVRLTNDANQYVIADAIRIQRIDDLPPASGAQIIDNGETGFAIESGTWGSAGGGVNSNIRFAATGDGSAVASWTFTGLVAGQYRVSATWAEHNNRATDSPFTIYDGGTERGTVDVDQQLVPSGSPELTDLGAAWQDLGGLHNIAGDTLVVRLTNDANQYVIADAIRIQRIEPLLIVPEIQVLEGITDIVDDTGGVSFGSTEAGTPVSKTFTVKNVGTADLTLQPVSAPAGFTVTTNIAANTVLAPGTQTTFTVRLDAAVEGTFSGQLSLANTDSDEDPFDFAISGTVTAVGLSPAQIIDNGETGFAIESGTWGSAGGGVNSNIRFAATGDGSAVASWTFTGLVAGQYRVSATWAAHNNRATDSPFTIYDGATERGTVDVDQQLVPSGSPELTDLGAAWQDLGGLHNIAGDTLVVRLTNDANQYVIADAIRIQRIEPLLIVPEIQVLEGITDIVDDTGGVSFGSTEAGTPVSKTFTVKNVGTADLTLQPVSAPAGFTVTTNIAANTVLAPGTQTTFTVRLDAAVEGTFSGQLSLANTDSDEDPFDFAISGTVTAVGLSPAQIIDNGETGFAIESGTWGSAGGGVNSNIRFAATGDGSAVASWTFTGLVAGQYRVSATWAAHNNRATDSPFTIYDGATERGTVDVDQQLVPSGSPELTDLGAAWQDLGGLHNIAGDTLVVRLTNDANQYVIADAIRIQRIEPLLIVPEIQVLEGITDIVDDTGGVSFGSTEAGTPVSKTFTVKNVGTADLTLQPVSAPAGFTVTTNIAANTVLAPGTQTTFTVRLDAAVEGTFSGQLSLANTDSDEDPFDFAISGTVTAVGLSPAQIIDNGETGFAIESGTWGSAGGGVNSNIRFAATGDGSAVASWTFTGLVAGQYRVSATWAEHNNRATDSPFTIYDGGTERGTVDVDQQLVPSGSPELTDLGAAWQDLGGLHNIAGDTLVVRLTNDANQYVIADAIRIQRIGDLPPASGAQIIDNGETGFAIESGTWGSAGGGVNANIRFAATGDGSAVASWTFTGLVAGQYRVSATWAAHNNRATDSPFTIYDGATERGTVDVNQQLVPSGSPELTDLGAAWQDLGGLHNITGDTLVVRLTNDANQFVIADAIRIERIS